MYVLIYTQARYEEGLGRLLGLTQYLREHAINSSSFPSPSPIPPIPIPPPAPHALPSPLCTSSSHTPFSSFRIVRVLIFLTTHAGLCVPCCSTDYPGQFSRHSLCNVTAHSTM